MGECCPLESPASRQTPTRGCARRRLPHFPPEPTRGRQRAEGQAPACISQLRAVAVPFLRAWGLGPGVGVRSEEGAAAARRSEFQADPRGGPGGKVGRGGRCGQGRAQRPDARAASGLLVPGAQDLLGLASVWHTRGGAAHSAPAAASAAAHLAGPCSPKRLPVPASQRA